MISLDDNEDVYSNNSKEKSKDIETHPAYLIMSSPLGNHAIRHFHFVNTSLIQFPYFSSEWYLGDDIILCQICMITDMGILKTMETLSRKI